MTPNEMLCKFLLIPIVFIDTFVNMLLFTTILNIKCTKKQKIYYFLISSIAFAIIKLSIPNTFNFLFCYAVYGILTYVILTLSGFYEKIYVEVK